MTLNAPAPVAAWYPDPTDPDSLRWWDGLGWTSHTRLRPAQVPASLPMPDPATAYVPEAPPTAAPVDPVAQAPLAPQVPPVPAGASVDAAQILAALAAAPAPSAGTAGIAAVPPPAATGEMDLPSDEDIAESLRAARAAFSAAQEEKTSTARASATMPILPEGVPFDFPTTAPAAPAAPAAAAPEEQFTSVAQARAAFAAKKAAAAAAAGGTPEAAAAPAAAPSALPAAEEVRPVSVAAARAAAAKAKAEAAAAGAQAPTPDKVDEQGRKWHLPKF